jgi:Mrp family chromosome partitioning ATPase
MQLEALECGAAALAMILAYYEKWIPLEQVRHDCGVSRDGSNAKNILRAARSYGLKAQGYRYETDELRKNGKFPCIVHWNFNHFVVLNGFKGNKVVLVDLDGKKPALYKIFGAKYIEKAELGKLLNGEISRSEFRLRRYKKSSLSLAINVNSYPDNYLWIESGVAKEVIDALKEQVDYIIIDTAPLSVDSTVTDIAKFVDQTMLVVRTDKVRSTAINDAIITIGEVGGSFAGCILNDVFPDFAFFGIAGAEDNGGYYYSKKGYGKNYNSYGKYAATIKTDSDADDDYNV